MGDNIYFDFWKNLIPEIVNELKAGFSIISLPVLDLKKFGDRQSYYANFRISKGILKIPRNAYAHGRDFYAALIEDEYFKTYLKDLEIQTTISKDLKLKMEILNSDAPEFFTNTDFVELAMVAKKKWKRPDHDDTYQILKKTYKKIEYWASQVKNRLFEGGAIGIRKAPTNQANYFDSYLWAQIYPDKRSFNFKNLAYTIEINNYNTFLIKIDTVKLKEGDTQRNKYATYRGEFDTSKIVKSIPKDEILGRDWTYLIELTCNIIDSFNKDYNTLLDLLSGNELKSNEKSMLVKQSLNKILYGPPGTGKTYHTINKALSIIENKSENDLGQETRDELKERYQAYVTKGQIVFTTFHQSMSYEDFVEGIKPEIEEDKEGLRSVVYDVKAGLFKKLCEKAEVSSIKEEQPVIYQFEEAWNDLLAEVRWAEDSMDDFVLDILTPKRGLKVKEITDQGNLRLTPISVVGLDYTVSYTRAKKLQAAFPDLSLVKNIDKEFRTVIGGSNSTAYWAVINNLNKKIEKNHSLIEEDMASLKPHVLIIDEINRGNVSAIFGELITLIEESKRQGKPEALEVVLPYSKQKFSVPSNLYIIGTMNTADRSVEALDTALRRRFSFVEMLPQPDHESIGSVDGMPLGLVLEKINKRLEKLLSRDNTIGHSFFINVETAQELYDAFYNKIIPLLQEYFFGDYGKIGLVLGSAFVELVTNEKTEDNFFATFEYEEKDMLFEKKVYRILKFNNDYLGFLEAVKAI